MKENNKVLSKKRKGKKEQSIDRLGNKQANKQAQITEHNKSQVTSHKQTNNSSTRAHLP